MNHYSTILLLPRSTHFPYTTLFQSHRDGDDRRGEAHRLEDHRAVLRAERVARRRVLEAHDGNDLTGTDTLAFLAMRSEEHTSELHSHSDLVCRLLLEKKKRNKRKSL